MKPFLLGNTFFRNDPHLPGGKLTGFSRLVSAVSPSTATLSLKEYVFGLGCDSFFKKVASQSLREMWLYQIIFLIFGLWLATV